jgi:hypothetical protein
MTRPFTCSNCGITTTKRSHFWWLLAVVGFFNGQIWVSDEGAISARCTPSWATALGRVIYVLMAICILLLVWQFTHRPSSDTMQIPKVTENSRCLA